MNRDTYIAESLEDLDLSPTMEKNAREKYQALSIYLAEQGLETDFYPQGSFLIGTVIKPYINGREHNYDLDVLCILRNNKIETTPQIVKTSVGEYIKNSGIYSGKLKKEDRYCWTLQYAEVTENVGFSLDVVPSVNEASTEVEAIISSGVINHYANQVMSITDKYLNSYSWLTSNPLGFGKWFLEISDLHITQTMMAEQRTRFPKSFIQFYDKTEDIPTFYYRSNLQRAVQLIKRHRDIFYDRSGIHNNKPSSTVITALVADAVKDKYFLNISDIIKIFIDGIKSRSISIMGEQKVINPVDRREDLTSKWSNQDWRFFDIWILKLEVSIFNSIDDIELKKSLRNSINTKAFSELDNGTTVVSSTKPWSV